MKKFPFSLDGPALRGLIVAAGLAVTSPAVLASPDAASVAALQAAHPGVRVSADSTVSNGWTTKFYGKPMTSGATPQLAVDSWLALHGTSFGAGQLELTLDHAVEIMEGKFTVHQYSQSRNGVPVEYGQLIALVLNAPSNPRNVNEVVYVSGTLADAVVNGQAPAIGAAQAAANAHVADGLNHLTQWDAPQLVVYFGENVRSEARLAWKTTGSGNDDAWTLFFDARTGDLLHSRSEVLNHGPEQVNISGTITGNGSPGALPDMATNPPVEVPLRDALADHSGGGSAFTDASGDYSIPFGGSGNVSVSTSMNDGQWVNIDNDASGGVLNTSGSFTAGPGADLLYNSSPSEYLTSQVNVFRYANAAHNYIKDRAPQYNALDIAIEANCNVNQTCNATFNGANLTINFFRAGGGCNNTGYAGVVSHEYGHFMVNRRGLAQGAFGEGFGDTMSVLEFDDPIIGRFFFTSGGVIRDIVGDNVQYPCSGGIHFCGELLGGVVWDLRLNMGATYGSAPGLDLTRDLHAAWYLMTSGGQGSNSAHPDTAIEFLTVDDNDGNIENGTPNYNDICAAFASHSIDCPELALLTFDYPNGRPDELTPQQPTTFLVDVSALNATPQQNSGELVYRIDGGSFTTVAMTQTTPNQYEVVLPGVPCASVVEYYVQADTTSGSTATNPTAAPSTLFSAVSGQLSVVLADNFQTNMGWTEANLGASTGDWQRGDPVNDPNWAYDPASDSDGSGNAYVTQNQIGNTDVDDGAVQLTSPTIDMSGEGIAASYDYYLNMTNPSGTDRLRVEVNNNNGSGAWTILVDHTASNNLAWATHTFTGDDMIAVGVTPTATTKLRFTANDANPQSIVEAGIDAVNISSVSCSVACYADCDGNGSLNILDYICFGDDYAAGGTYADCDNSGSLNILDYICFGDAFAAGCP